MKHIVEKQGERYQMRKYPLKYGGFWSVLSANGSEAYFPSEEEAEAHFNKVEALIPKPKGEDSSKS